MKKMQVLTTLVLAVMMIAPLGCSSPSQKPDPGPSIEAEQPEAPAAPEKAETPAPAEAEQIFVFKEPVPDYPVEPIYHAVREVVYDKMHMQKITKKNNCGKCGSSSTDKADYLTATIDARSAENIELHIRINFLSEDASEMSITAINNSDRQHNLENYCGQILNWTLRRLAQQAASETPADPWASQDPVILNGSIERITEEALSIVKEIGMDTRDYRKDFFCSFLSFRSSQGSDYSFTANFASPGKTEVALKRNGTSSRHDQVMINTMMKKIEQKLQAPPAEKEEAAEFTAVLDKPVLMVYKHLTDLAKTMRFDARNSNADAFGGYIYLRTANKRENFQVSISLLEENSCRVTIKKEGLPGPTDQLIIQTILNKLREKVNHPPQPKS